MDAKKKNKLIIKGRYKSFLTAYNYYLRERNNSSLPVNIYILHIIQHIMEIELISDSKRANLALPSVLVLVSNYNYRATDTMIDDGDSSSFMIKFPSKVQGLLKFLSQSNTVLHMQQIIVAFVAPGFTVNKLLFIPQNRFTFISQVQLTLKVLRFTKIEPNKKKPQIHSMIIYL